MELDEPTTLLRNPKSYFSKMILAAANVQGKDEISSDDVMADLSTNPKESRDGGYVNEAYEDEMSSSSISCYGDDETFRKELYEMEPDYVTKL